MTGDARSLARCDVTELLVPECDHCKSANRRPAGPPLFRAPTIGADRPPVVEARHHSRCPGCDDVVEPGEYITKTDDDTWVHVGCEE